MRLASIANLKPGVILSRPVLDGKGQVLLCEGVELTQEYLTALANKGFHNIFVRDPDSAIDVPADEDLDPIIRAKALNALHKTFTAVERELGERRGAEFEELKQLCQTGVLAPLMAKGGPFADLVDVVSSILDDVLTRGTLAGLVSIKSADSHLHNHSIDVCVIAIMIGRAIHTTDLRLRQLATGCLLHDIGKIFLEKRANPRTEVRQHTLLGYELLKCSDEPDILAPHVALEHHERQNGTGEPRGLAGTNTIERDRNAPGPVMTLIGEIAAVANVYDNLLNGTPIQPPMPHDNALQAVRSAAGSHLNKAVVNALLRIVPVYPMGTEILVRSAKFRNYTGIVTQVNAQHLDKPVVTLIRDARGVPIPPIEVDLLKEDDVQVRCKTS